MALNLFEETKNRPNESTNSSDSGIIVEEIIIKADNEASAPPKKSDTNIKIETEDHQHHSNSDFIQPCKDNNSSSNVKIEDDNEDKRTFSSEHSDNHSHNISIVSLEEVDSSVIDSDSDFSDGPDEFVIQKLGQHPRASDVANDGIVIVNNRNNGLEPSCSTESGVTTNKPQIGSIAVQNSTDITFGNKTFYQGPVTIKQFLLENKKWTPKENGADNEGFENDEFKKAAGGENSKTDPDLIHNGLRKKLMFDSKPVFITGVLILISVILCAITFTTLAFVKSSSNSDKTGDGDDSRKNIPINSTIGNDNIAGGKVLRIITRDEWIAQPPNNKLTPLELPATKIIITHTATEGCETQAECVFRVRYIQTFHMESRNWDDIAYNFLVGGDGSVYEGRGWDQMGAHTKGFNTRSIGIAFVGTFTKLTPPDKQLRAAQMIIAEGVALKKLTPDYQLFGHRQLIASESPGEALYKIIKTWPHWSEKLDS